VGKERVVLEHGVDVALVGRETRGRDPVELDRARVRPVEAGDEAQAGRLARPRGTEQREELAVRDFEAHVPQRRHVAEAACDALEPDGRCQRPPITAM
jgi:hypothetical protein